MDAYKVQFCLFLKKLKCHNFVVAYFGVGEGRLWHHLQNRPPNYYILNFLVSGVVVASRVP